MDDLPRAMQLASAAARPFPAVSREVEKAIELTTFKAHDPLDGPYRPEGLHSGVPQPPEGPMFPAFAAIRGHAALDPLIDALEHLQHQLVWAADCAEFTDAVHNSAQFLRAAGHLDLAQRTVLALAGPGLGLVLVPPVYMRDLAAGLGLALNELLPEGEISMGSLPPSSLVRASYHWDIHHEEPVTSAETLGPRTLSHFSVRFDGGRTRCEGALALAPHRVGGRRRYGPFFFDDADSDPFTLEWYEETPDWAVPPPDHDARVRALATLAAATTAEELDAALAALPADIRVAGRSLEFVPPIPALDLAGPDPYARTIDVHMSHWRVEPVRFGAWEVDASLDGPATGEPVPGLVLPAARACRLTPADTVRHLRIL